MNVVLAIEELLRFLATIFAEQGVRPVEIQARATALSGTRLARQFFRHAPIDAMEDGYPLAVLLLDSYPRPRRRCQLCDDSYYSDSQYVSEVIRKINKYLDDNLPLSVRFLYQSAVKQQHDKRYDSAPHYAFALWPSEPEYDMAELALLAGLSTDEPTLLSYSPLPGKITHPLTTHAFSPTIAAASRKPTALPLRQ